ncbi:hypothetical protein H2684_03645 [Clostridium sp. cel8]|jgi:lipopolysaccharide export LptBFGC system permease protein LptF|uniref:hypothetical protein n=1 Tax=Clostridium sp. cel8 TaxID=2663123 RepID=UPI0015F6B265|nr:hypothetical protein [Clostridium sp. cel8]MBA5850413.1 hypothetical protein [Clostridium sp. cel8]
MNKKKVVVICVLIVFLCTTVGVWLYFYNRGEMHNSLKSSSSNVEQNRSKKVSNNSRKEIDNKNENKNISNLNSTNTSKDNTSINTNKGITKDQAVELVNKYAQKGDKNAKCIFDHEQMKDNRKYYVIHVFDEMEDHIATTGWYYVDILNGNVYEYDIANNKLILIE